MNELKSSSNLKVHGKVELEFVRLLPCWELAPSCGQVITVHEEMSRPNSKHINILYL